jgi:DNA-binding MarR family transcriptional regulator
VTDIKSIVDELINSACALEKTVVQLREENAALKDKNSNRKKLSSPEVARIRLLHQTGDWTQAAIADAFDINPATVSRIVRGQYWS